jgi:hypothetical protein
LEWLNMLYASGVTVCKVATPSDAPEFWQTNRFGAPVVRGDSLTAVLDDGSIVHP